VTKEIEEEDDDDEGKTKGMFIKSAIFPLVSLSSHPPSSIRMTLLCVLFPSLSSTFVDLQAADFGSIFPSH
jgi:hypothetical protein